MVPTSGKMAAPEAPWNRLDVPWPASSVTVALPAKHPAVRWLPVLRRRCYIANKRLSGTGLANEGRVLRAVLYAYHSRLLRHRSYLAMQQVEQCLKRLWKMNLVGSLETLAELIPKKNTSQDHVECLVPSQPVLETVALKVLGGCKLILRLLDCCCKAFLNFRRLAGCCSSLEQPKVWILIFQIIPDIAWWIASSWLSVKHLCSEEYILVNTVASGLLSRLWIQYRCVLQSLTSLYGTLSTSLHLISETQQMPYIKGFTFPSDISNFLGVDISSDLKKQKARMLTTKKPPSWLKKLFPAMPKAVSEVGKKRHFATCMSAVKKHSIPCPTDIGELVLGTRASRGKPLGFDVKSLLRSSRPPAQEGISLGATSFKAKSASLSSQRANSQHIGPLVQMVQAALSFGELSEALRKAILWCKGNKFRSEAYFLRNKLLKSNRLYHVEAQGCSLKRKLCCIKTSIRKYLLYGSQRRHWPKQQDLGAWLCRRRIKSSVHLKRTRRTVWQKPPELSGIPAYQDRPLSQEGQSNTDPVELHTAGTPKQLLLKGSPGPVWKEAADNTDIDSIFAAMGV